jgi:hypothetical protein
MNSTALSASFNKEISTPALLCLFLFLHALIAAVACGDFAVYAQALTYLDGGWYLHIAENGYTPRPFSDPTADGVWAFLPLWPLLLRFPTPLPTQVFGALLSMTLFCFAMLRLRYQPRTRLVPLSLVAFIFSPAAFTFATNHTESLFLLFTILGSQSRKRTWLWGGLAALTRNQGILLAAMFAWQRAKETPSHFWQTFAAEGSRSGAIFLLWPLYQYSQTGSFFASQAAQSIWHQSTSLSEYISCLFWISPGNIGHAAVLWLSLAVAVHLFWRERAPLGFYVAASVLLWPLQGHSFPNAYRYSAVLLPVWLTAGDLLDSWLARFPPFTKLIVAAAWIACTAHLSYRYFSQLGWVY